MIENVGVQEVVIEGEAEVETGSIEKMTERQQTLLHLGKRKKTNRKGFLFLLRKFLLKRKRKKKLKARYTWIVLEISAK